MKYRIETPTTLQLALTALESNSGISLSTRQAEVLLWYINRIEKDNDRQGENILNLSERLAEFELVDLRLENKRLRTINADLLAMCERTREGYQNLIELNILPHDGWDDQTREYIKELDMLIAKAEGES